MIFWDTSLFARCYDSGEPGHPHALNLLRKTRGHLASILLRPEALGALARKCGPNRTLRDSMIRRVEEDLLEFDLMPLAPEHVELSVRLIREHPLRGIDALHLSAALAAARDFGRRGFRFATADGEQAAAARARGLRVIESRGMR